MKTEAAMRADGELGDERRPMQDRTDNANLLRAYVRAWPLEIGGSADGERHGFKFHTQSQRNSDLTHRHGFEIGDGHRPKEGGAWRWQLASLQVLRKAQKQILSWDTGIPLEELRDQGARSPAEQRARDLGQGSLL